MSLLSSVSRDCVGDHARKNGWQSWGRTSWQKLDGTIVHYLHFPEQAVAVDRGDKVHAVGISLEMEIALGRASKENPEALQGFHEDNLMFLFDEASGVPDIVFEVGMGALATPGAKVVMTGNPTRNSGMLYDSHHR